jgi:hypothetical protein
LKCALQARDDGSIIMDVVAYVKVFSFLVRKTFIDIKELRGTKNAN